MPPPLCLSPRPHLTARLGTQAALPQLQEQLAQVLKEGVSREDVQEVKATFRDMGVDIEVHPRARATARYLVPAHVHWCDTIPSRAGECVR